MHKGDTDDDDEDDDDDDDDNNNNNNNNNNEFIYNAEDCLPINTELEYSTTPVLPILGTVKS